MLKPERVVYMLLAHGSGFGFMVVHRCSRRKREEELSKGIGLHELDCELHNGWGGGVGGKEPKQ